MKQLLIFLAAFFVFTIQAQTPVLSLRVEPAGGDTSYLVEKNARTFPDGTIVVEERWVPVVGKNNLKRYLATVDTVFTKEEQEEDRRRASRQEARKAIKQLQKELEKNDVGGGGRRDAVTPAEPAVTPTSPTPRKKKKG